MFEDNWQTMFDDDLDKLSEIINPVREKTVKLEEGENRIVSIFFLDIKGFTAMSEKLHPEQVKRTIDRIFKVFSNVILKYGGYVSQYEGDKIIAFFGSRITSETDTERAIRSGLEILGKLKQINEMLKHQTIELGIRIGINTGLVTTGRIGLGREKDFTVYGDAVNLASRMESNAPINSILIPLKTKELVTDIFQFESLGKIEIKGKSQPVEIFKVLGVAPKKVERWERSKLVHKPEYVGRDRELKQIEELYEKSRLQIGKIDSEYKPMVIGLRSPAGLGKSRLIYEFVQRIKKKYKLDSQISNNIWSPPLQRRQEMSRSEEQNSKYFNIKVSGYTKSYAQAPYTLWTSLIKNYIGINETDTKETVRDKFEHSFSEITNELTKIEKQNFEKAKPILGFILGLTYKDIRLYKPDPKSLQTEIILSIRYSLEAITKIANNQEYPMIIILEDLHWIDESSLSALKTILSSLNVEEKRNHRPCKNMFFILTYRDEFELLREFEFRTRFVEFILQPLTSTNSDQMIKSMLGTIDMPERLRMELMTKSEGNPFYIEEWIHSLIDEDIIHTKNGKCEIKGDIENICIPNTLNNLILSRMDRLEERLKALLQKASVIGNSFLQSILEAIEKKLGNDEPIQPELSELIDLDWLIKEKEFNESDVQYLFKHILACDVAYQTILNYNKKILHKLIAEFVEEKFRDNKEYYAFLAEHYYKAEDSEKAVEYLEKAGDYAKENYQNELAIGFYDKLFKIPDSQFSIPDYKLIDTLLKRGSILQLIGKWKETEDIFKEALTLSKNLRDNCRIGKSYEHLGTTFRLKGDYDKATECYERSLKIFEGLGDKRKISIAVGEIGSIFWHKGNYNKAMEFFEKQLNIAEELKDNEIISKAVGNIGNVHWSKGDYNKAMDCYKKKLKVVEELGDKNGVSITIGNIGSVHYFKGNYNKAMECFERDLEISEKLGDKWEISRAVGNIGSVYYDKGDHNNAIRYYNKQLKICEELGDKSGVSKAVGNIGVVYEDNGDYKKAMECYEKQLKISTELGNKRGISNAVGNIGDVHKAKGEYEKAVECYEKQLKISAELGDKRGITIAVGNMGLIYYYKGDYNKAMDYYERAISICREINLKHYLSYVLSYKVKVLFKRKEFEKAKEVNQECIKKAKKIGDNKHIFSLSVLSSKIDFALAKDETSQNNAMLKLQQMLTETEDNEEKATLNYELGIMNYELKGKKISRNYKNEALRLYEELYKKTPKFEYKKRIEELRRA